MKNPKKCTCTDIPENTYHKIAAVIVKDGKTLVVKKKGLDEYISLGGKHEGNETFEECLKRESLEELNIQIHDPIFMGRYTDITTADSAPIILDAYLVQSDDQPEPTNEIEKFLWVTKNYDENLASIVERNIIPELIKKGLM